MIFGLIKFIIWLAGVVVIAYFVLPYFGYEMNTNYLNESKAVCQQKIEQCQKNLIKSGLDGVKEKCDFWCIDPKLLIKKLEKTR